MNYIGYALISLINRKTFNITGINADFISAQSAVGNTGSKKNDIGCLSGKFFRYLLADILNRAGTHTDNPAAHGGTA